MAVYVTHSKQETVYLGRQLAGTLHGGELILFTGGLGAGKTAFCEGLAQGLGCTDPVSSPTFSIVNYYRGPIPLAHFDLYRAAAPADLELSGFFDYLDAGAVVAAEWSENAAGFLAGQPAIRVSISHLPGEENGRRIVIEGGAL